jgi:hypothetical protein
MSHKGKPEREMETLALEMYAARLRRLFDTPAPKDNTERRERIRATLDLTAELTKRLRVPDAVAGSIGQLAAAVSALNVGDVNPLLAPTDKRGGPPRDPAEVWKLRADVALAVECLASAPGKTRQWAITQVAAKFKNLKRLCRRANDDFATSAESWVVRFRKEAETLRLSHTATIPVEAVEAFADGLAVFKAFTDAGRIAPDDIAAHGRAILSAANTQAAHLI